MTLGQYPKDTKDKYLKTTPKLDDVELVMEFETEDGKTIKNQIMQAWETPYMKELAEIAKETFC